jgi:enoyl-CoA hydratase
VERPVTVHFEERGRVGLLTIDRQERRNALDQEHCDALRTALDDHRDLRAVVLTGAGSAFCSGADLVTRFEPGEGGGGDGGGGAGARVGAGAGAAAGGAAPKDAFRPAFEVLLDAIVAFPAPVVAAVNGPAIGAGMQLAVACDHRVAALGARLSIPAGRLGIHLSPRNIWRLALLVGQPAARRFLLSGWTVTAEEARECGLVDVLASDAVEAALALAGEIASLAPLTVQGHKRALNLVAEAQWPGPDAVAEMARLEERAFASEDLQEGLAAFEEKRTPDFDGR